MVREIYKVSFASTYIMNKKGAIGLSINAIVVIIISLVVLGGGISLLYKFISGAEQLKGDLDKRTADELERLLIDQGKKVALPLHVASVSRGDGHVFGIGILNSQDTEQSFFVNVKLRKVIDETEADITSQVSPQLVEEWVFYNTEALVISSGTHHKEAILVNVPNEALKGQYIFTATVTMSGVTYGNPQTFYVSVR